MVQALHQLVVVFQAVLSIFGTADQLCSRKHLVPQQCHDLLFHWLKLFGMEHHQGFSERKFTAEQKLEKGKSFNQYAVWGGLHIQVPEQVIQGVHAGTVFPGCDML